MIWSFLQHLSSFAGVCAGLGLLVIAGLLWSHWRERRPAVRISPELAAQYRSEVVFNAVKQKGVLRADFQRGNRQ